MADGPSLPDTRLCLRCGASASASEGPSRALLAYSLKSVVCAPAHQRPKEGTMSNSFDDVCASAGRRRFMSQIGAAGAASAFFPASLLHAQTATSTLRIRMGGDIALLDPGKI